MKHQRIPTREEAAEHRGHPHDAGTYLDRLSPMNARIAAGMARQIFPDFDAMQARIRAERNDQ